MKKAIICILASTTLISSHLTFAAGTPYIGGSLGLGGYNSQTGYIGNLIGGYGATFGSNQKFYLGGELNLHVGNFGNYLTTYGLGISLLPGLMLSDKTMIYTRFGIDTTYLPHMSNTYQTKPQIGLGLQTALTNHLDIRGEYTAGSNNTGSYNIGLIYKLN